jgi:hypothetical protein
MNTPAHLKNSEKDRGEQAGRPALTCDGGDAPKKRFASIEYCTNVYGPCRRRWYDLLGEGRVRGVKCGNATLLDLESVEQYFASLPAPSIRAPRARQMEAA